MKLVAVILVTILVAAGIGAAVWKRAGVEAQAIGTPVRLETVNRRDLTELVTAPGVVEPKTKVSISARVAAHIVELPHPEGDPIKKGDVLVRLDSKDLEAELRATQARYAAQAANIDVARSHILQQKAAIEQYKVMMLDAKRDLKRQTELLSTHDVSQSVVDEAQAKYDQCHAQVEAADSGLAAEDANLQVMQHQLEAADAEIAQAKDNLGYAVMSSPIDGVVTKLNAEVGELVVTGTMNNPGTVIMEVADLNTMLFKARMDESSITAVKVGQKAKVRIPAYRDRDFDGVVQTAALAKTEEKDGTTYFKVEVLIKNDGQRILSGLTGDADIETEEHRDVIAVPSQAVVGRPVDDLPSGIRDAPEVDKTKTQQPVVYRMINGKAVVTPVTVGPSDVTRTMIKSGLKEGDVVVVGPYKVLETIQHDQKIKDEKAATTQPTTKPA